MNAETAPVEGGSDDRSATSDQSQDTAPVGDIGGTFLEQPSHRSAVQHFDVLAAGVGSEYRFAVHSARAGRWTTEFFAPTATRDVAALGVEWAAGGADVYVGPGVYTAATAAHLARLGRRGGASDVAGIVSLGFDFDVDVDDDDETLAREVLRRAALDPGLVVHSGGGIHVWVLLDRPLMFTSADARDRWSTVVRAVWEAVDAVVRDMGVADRFRGGKLDPTFDLPRVLRLGGTLNYKQRKPRPVRILDGIGSRVTVEQLTEIAAPRLRSTPTGLSIGAVAVGSDRPVVETVTRVMPMVDLAREVDVDVDRTWRGDRPDLADQSASSYDLALASRLAAADWSDRDVADAIVARRVAAGDDLDKVTRRRDYLARTVAKAHETSTSPRGAMSAKDVRDVVARAADTGVRP